jgi:hypothetical protein
MQFYYEVFISLDERPSILTNYIGAGLFISGKYLLNNGETEAAVQYFDNIAVSCSEYTKFLRAIITFLSERDMAKDAEKYLLRFPISAKNEDDYIISDFLLSAKMGYEPSKVVKLGLDVYNRKIRDVEVMKALIKAMEMNGYKQEKLAKYQAELDALMAVSAPPLAA